MLGFAALGQFALGETIAFVRRDILMLLVEQLLVEIIDGGAKTIWH